MSLVIDANVFVAAALVEDKFHQTSAEFLLEARLQGGVIYAPTLILAEVAGVVSRARKDHAYGDVAALRIERFPKTRLRIADGPFARRAARLASRHALSGADAHYVAVASEFGSTLITLDDQLLELGPQVVVAMTPRQWFKSK
jgi:predicted nucleic acid-binding protein